MFRAIAICGFFFLVGCEPTAPDQEPVDGPEIRPPYEWSQASLATSGLDSLLIDSALSASQAESFLYSLLVVRHGSLAVEYNRPPLTRFNDYDIRSSTKSIVSLLFGICPFASLQPHPIAVKSLDTMCC